MLKKRILASSMASVMALSSVSVAAFADEATDKKYGETVTAAELQEYVDSLEDFAENELEEYGTKQGDQFTIVYEHAKNVLENAKSTEVDYNGAYQMLKAVKDQLVIRTCAEVKALVKKYQSIYDDNNRLNDNEEFQDLVYDEDTYTEFVTAFENALAYETSGASRDVTDAWVGLQEAYDGLEENKVITKAEFRAAFAAYQDLELEMKKTESWRRGVLTVKPTSGEADKNNLVSKSAEVDMAGLIDMVYGNSGANYWYWNNNGSQSKWAKLAPAHEVIDEDTGSSNVEDRCWIGSPDLPRGSSVKVNGVREYSMSLYDAITYQYKKMTEASGITKTSDAAIVAAYEAAVDAVKVFEGWSADKYSSGSKTSTTNILKSYNNDLVIWNRPQVIADIMGVPSFDYLDTKKTSTNTVEYIDSAGKTQKAIFTWDPIAKTLKCNKKVYFAKNAYANDTSDSDNIVYADTYLNGYMHEEEADYIPDLIKFVESEVSYGGEYTTKTEKQSVAANNDILKYIFFCEPMVTVSGSAASRAAAIARFAKHYGSSALIATAPNDYTNASETDGIIGGLYNAGKIKANSDGEMVLTISNAKIISALYAAVSGSGTAPSSVSFKLVTLDSSSDETHATYVSKNNAKVAAIWKAYSSIKKASDPSDDEISEITAAYGNGADLLWDEVLDANVDDLSARGCHVTTKSELESVVLENANWCLKIKTSTDDDVITDGCGQSSGTDFTIYKYVPGTAEEYSPEVLAHNALVDDLITYFENIPTVVKADETSYRFTSASLSKGNKVENSDALVSAIKFYWYYTKVNFKDDDQKAEAKDAINDLANRDDDAEKFNTVSGSNAEWTLVWRNLAYALDDMFHEPEDSKYTRNDIQTLIDKAYEAMDLTGDSALFADPHKNVVDRRDAAITWLKEANAQNAWKSTDTFSYACVSGGEADITTVYEDLDKYITVLTDWYAGFTYSYEEIRQTISDVSKDIDEGTVSSSALKQKLSDVSYELATLKTSIVSKSIGAEDNAVFNDSCVFQYANRLKTQKKKSVTNPSKSEKQLKSDYESLLKLYEEAKGTTTTGVLGDVDSDGKFTIADITVMIDAYMNAKETTSAYDMDGDGKFTIADVTAAIATYMG